MRPDDTEPDDAASLRGQAEEALRAQPARSNGSLSHEEALAQVHELQVHQIELELQNEELLRTRREAEALRDRYADLYDFAPVGYATLDGAGAIREVNLTGSLLLSTDRQALIGARFSAFLHPGSRAAFAAFTDRVRSTGGTETVELPMLGPDGREGWCARLSGRADPAGPVGVGRIRLVISDVTEGRRAADALAESERHYRRLYETMVQGVIYQDADGRITAMNPAAERVLGRAPADYLDPGLAGAGHDAIHEDGTLFPDPEHPAMVALRTGQEVQSVVMGVYNPREQRYRWINIHAVPLFPQGSATPDQVYIIFDDITEQRAVEAAAREAAEKLRVSNEELQRFAYVASHDLQEPLRSIVSFSQLLDRKYRGQLDADADEYIGFITEGGIRMQTLIQDLLRLSRVDTQAGPPVRTASLGAVTAALQVLEEPIREAGATVTVGGMPAVLADPAQLEQVFVNLVGNAVKYRDPDRPLEVRVSAERENGCWRFAVEDNGIGIDPEYFDRIFVIFQRLHTREAYPGTGIGLAMVRKIVERHGGRIWVESVPGEGSTFFFTLPAA